MPSSSSWRFQTGLRIKPASKTGDAIVAVNGQPVPGLIELTQQIKQAGNTAVLRLEIWRHGERAALAVGLGSAKEARAPSAEQFIPAWRALIEAFPKDAFPTLWASTQFRLGAAYALRAQGSRAENIETAIKAYGAALTV